MGKKAIIGIVIVVVVLAGGGALLFAQRSSNNDDSTGDMNMPSDTNSSTDTSSDNSTATATNSVTIENFAFSPASITVKKGTTVTWTNKDTVAHTVTQDSGTTGPDSPTLANGKSYSFTYDTVGTFKYHCTPHPNMMGTVVVTE